jgi:hypothetical protein
MEIIKVDEVIYLYLDVLFLSRALLRRWKMKTEVEKFREAIESLYESPGYFTERQLIKMKKLRKERKKIYAELAKLNPELFSEVAFIIETGFFNIWDDKAPMRDHLKLFRKTKSVIRAKIDNYVKKTNKKLAEKDPYFKLFPITIIVKIMPHHLDYPPKKVSPRKNRPILVKDLSNSLKPRFPQKADREKFISNILQYFYGIARQDANPENIRPHL